MFFTRPTAFGSIAAFFFTLFLGGSFDSGSWAQTVTGTVRYEGPAFRLRAIRMNADPNCEKLHDERVLQDDKVVDDQGGLANVFLYLDEAPAGAGPYEPPQKAAELKQEGCMYQPKVQGVLVKQNVDVINADPTLHNVRCLAKDNRPFNLGQPAEGKRTKFFTKPEKAIKFKCDVHSWMASYIFVMDHPFFAVSAADGSFSLENIPAGTHTLIAWHETFGEKKVEIEVSDAGLSEVELVFGDE